MNARGECPRRDAGGVRSFWAARWSSRAVLAAARSFRVVRLRIVPRRRARVARPTPAGARTVAPRTATPDMALTRAAMTPVAATPAALAALAAKARAARAATRTAALVATVAPRAA